MAHLDHLSAHPAIPYRHLSPNLYARVGKRVLDLALALALLPVLGPLILILWALVRRDGGAGFFAHTRVGQNGMAFSCWKLRTMEPDAERKLADHLDQDPIAAEEWAKTQKLTDDPRVTPLGRFLRRTSLDELPQIWNVLRGDMSLVGPRPVTRKELGRYGPHTGAYLNLRPGVTGVWQVCGRANGCYAERLQMDQSYANTVGFLLDMVLLLRTGKVIFRPTGR